MAEKIEMEIVKEEHQKAYKMKLWMQFKCSWNVVLLLKWIPFGKNFMAD